MNETQLHFWVFEPIKMILAVMIGYVLRMYHEQKLSMAKKEEKMDKVILNFNKELKRRLN